MRRLLIVSAVALCGAAPAIAADPTPPSAPTTTVPEKPICRSEMETGSNIPERHCHTKAEWAELAKQHEAEIRSMRDGGHWSTNGH